MDNPYAQEPNWADPETAMRIPIGELDDNGKLLRLMVMELRELNSRIDAFEQQAAGMLSGDGMVNMMAKMLGG